MVSFFRCGECTVGTVQNSVRPRDNAHQPVMIVEVKACRTQQPVELRCGGLPDRLFRLEARRDMRPELPRQIFTVFALPADAMTADLWVGKRDWLSVGRDASKLYPQCRTNEPSSRQTHTMTSMNGGKRARHSHWQISTPKSGTPLRVRHVVISRFRL